ncbi:MAG: IspD/TarI family cytidylyltransferase [Spirochaetia bacterium]|nr:IspD/TarI family cytidylyltransferase [Spirochaetia bacterium]
MVTALIIAGGVGNRMGQDIPKQFINVYDKPVIIYTLEAFQNHREIDSIYAVCLEGWHDILWAYAKQFGITKLKEITVGGASAQESIRNGVMTLKDISDDDIVVIHDGVRPLVDDEVLSDVIDTCKKHGNAVTAMPYNEQIFVKKDSSTTCQYIPRDTLMRVSTPQAYKYGKLISSYKRAFKENIGIGPSSYTNTMMVDLGETLHFSAGSDRNIKLTTKDNLEIFKAYLKLEKDLWLK